MDNPIIYQGVFGLLIVFFLVLIYFFTRTWRWFHIVCVVFVFGASIFLVRYAAAVYRTLDTWRTLAHKTTQELEKLEVDNELFMYGRFDDTEQTVESVRLLHSKIGRVLLDRGRVWRNCTASPPQADGKITMNTVVPGSEAAAAPAGPAPAAPAPADAAAAATPAPKPAAPVGPAPNLIEKNTVLYVFLEGKDLPPETGAPPGAKLPIYYVGEFVADDATNTTVTLKPMAPLSNFDATLLRNGSSTWTLHDTMPVDGHEWFAENPDSLPNLNQPADTEPSFGKMNEAPIKALFTITRLPDAAFSGPTEVKDATDRLALHLSWYLRDGKSVPVTEKDVLPPMMVWTKVRFVKPHKEVVDSNATVSPFSAGVTDDFFDRGLAEVAILKLGKEAEFKEGDVALFPQENAQQLIAAGICEFREYVFVRPLNDYAFLFRNFDIRFDRIRDERERVERDIAELTKAQANINSQIALATDDQSKIQQDLTKTKEESDKIAEYLAILEKHWKDTRARTSAMYRQNLQLNEALKRLYQELSNAINRRIARADQ
jgi:hypothetical protein